MGKTTMNRYFSVQLMGRVEHARGSREPPSASPRMIGRLAASGQYHEIFTLQLFYIITKSQFLYTKNLNRISKDFFKKLVVELA